MVGQMRLQRMTDCVNRDFLLEEVVGQSQIGFILSTLRMKTGRNQYPGSNSRGRLYFYFGHWDTISARLPAATCTDPVCVLRDQRVLPPVGVRLAPESRAVGGSRSEIEAIQQAASDYPAAQVFRKSHRRF